jgi:hypothetical protein
MRAKDAVATTPRINALKLYLLLIAHRDGATGCAMIGYNKIEESSGIWREKIRPAISMLIAHHLVRVEQEKHQANTTLRTVTGF